jgi:hypothetical protein
LQTPLFVAVSFGKAFVVKILLWNGANINEKNVRNFKERKITFLRKNKILLG